MVAFVQISVIGTVIRTNKQERRNTQLVVRNFTRFALNAQSREGKKFKSPPSYTVVADARLCDVPSTRHAFRGFSPYNRVLGPVRKKIFVVVRNIFLISYQGMRSSSKVCRTTENCTDNKFFVRKHVTYVYTVEKRDCEYSFRYRRFGGISSLRQPTRTCPNFK